MYNKVFKNYQVNFGVPFQIKNPIGMDTIKKVEFLDDIDKDENELLCADNAAEILDNAKQEAELILKEAQLEAVKLMEDAKREIDSYRISAEEDARVKGYEAGIEEAKMQYEYLLQEAEFVRAHARTEYQEVLAGIENDAINLILEITRKVIGVEISFNRQDILYLVKEAFGKCSIKEDVALRVSTEDYEYIMENKEQLLSMVDGLGSLEIKRDNSMKAGGCIIETPFGSVDAGVQTKLDKIEEAFREIIGR